jgi:hypothetical protein
MLLATPSSSDWDRASVWWRRYDMVGGWQIRLTMDDHLRGCSTRRQADAGRRLPFHPIEA